MHFSSLGGSGGGALTAGVSAKPVSLSLSLGER